MELNQDFLSTAPYGGKAIDCRCLTFAFEFYQLSKERASTLATETILWLLDILPKERFICRETRSKSVEKALKDLHSRKPGYNRWRYDLEAYAISPTVYNIRTLTDHLRRLRHGAFDDVTDSYRHIVKEQLQYWNTLFPNGRESNEQVVKKILQIFNEENRIPVSNFYLTDVQASIYIRTYEKDQSQYHGYFYIDFSAFCLGSNLRGMAAIFSDFAQHVSETYVNLNARVMLQPVTHNDGHSPYSKYFGMDGSVDDSHLDTVFSEKEWYNTYYLPGVEWMNIISPLARTHIPSLCKEYGQKNGVNVQPLPGGGLLVQSKANIDEYGVAHAKKIKELVYPALYPGRSNEWLSELFSKYDSGKPIATLPREDWAIVPVFEDEIGIVSTYLVFAYSEDRKTGDKSLS